MLMFDVSYFKRNMEEWIKRWRMCVSSECCYLEEDKINLQKSNKKKM